MDERGISLYSFELKNRLEPDKGRVRRRYGGSWSIQQFRKGDVVQWHSSIDKNVGDDRVASDFTIVELELRAASGHYHF